MYLDPNPLLMPVHNSIRWKIVVKICRGPSSDLYTYDLFVFIEVYEMKFLIIIIPLMEVPQSEVLSVDHIRNQKVVHLGWL